MCSSRRAGQAQAAHLDWVEAIDDQTRLQGRGPAQSSKLLQSLADGTGGTRVAAAAAAGPERKAGCRCDRPAMLHLRVSASGAAAQADQAGPRSSPTAAEGRLAASPGPVAGP